MDMLANVTAMSIHDKKVLSLARNTFGSTASESIVEELGCQLDGNKYDIHRE